MKLGILSFLIVVVATVNADRYDRQSSSMGIRLLDDLRNGVQRTMDGLMGMISGRPSRPRSPIIIRHPPRPPFRPHTGPAPAPVFKSTTAAPHHTASSNSNSGFKVFRLPGNHQPHHNQIESHHESHHQPHHDLHHQPHHEIHEEFREHPVHKRNPHPAHIHSQNLHLQQFPQHHEPHHINEIGRPSNEFHPQVFPEQISDQVSQISDFPPIHHSSRHPNQQIISHERPLRHNRPQHQPDVPETHLPLHIPLTDDVILETPEVLFTDDVYQDKINENGRGPSRPRPSRQSSPVLPERGLPEPRPLRRERRPIPRPANKRASPKTSKGQANLIDSGHKREIVPAVEGKEGSRVRSYEFGYGVMDQDSGNRYFHAEKLNDGTKEGSYKIQLPDGRIQTVKYTADSTGFHPEVTYEGKAQYPESQPKEEKEH